MKQFKRFILGFLVLTALVLWTIGSTGHIESAVYIDDERVLYNQAPHGDAFVFVPTQPPATPPDGSAPASNTYSNMPYSKVKSKASKAERSRAYIDKYARAAVEVMKIHKIPASITLAQGLLESDAGDSRLARENNNHFGIKCHSRSCRPGHCTNYTDDSHKDFFRKYASVSDSYSGHSHLLKKARYNKLFKLDIRDYKGWAHGLKKAGYATDPEYGVKLIGVIETYGLQKYDNK